MNQLEAQCPICGTTTGEVIAQRLRRGEGTVWLCTTCDHGFIADLDSRELVDYYASEYRQHYSHKAVAQETNPQELFETYVSYQQERVDRVVELAGPTGTVLDVGASAGQFLYWLKDRVGPVSAIELDQSCCDYMKSELLIDSDSRPLRESKFAAKKFDVVTSFHVLEHTSEPVEFIADLVSVTGSNGWTVVEVPNLHDSLLSSWNLPNHERFFFHSAHAQYFSERSLSATAIAAGLNQEQISVSYSQDYNLLNHLHWLLNDVPQVDCHVGLSPVALPMGDSEIQKWLQSRLVELDSDYQKRLRDLKVTSNLVLTIENG